MKSRVNPNDSLFQIVVLDYAHRGTNHARTYVPVSPNNTLRGKTSNLPQTNYSKIDIPSEVPQKTLFRWAKDGRKAKRKVRRGLTVLSCRKVDSHYHRLNMIEHLNLEEKQVEVEFTVEEFTLNRNLELGKPQIEVEGRKIDIGGIDK